MWNLLGRVVVGSWIARRVGSWLAEGDEACGVERGRRRGEVGRGLVRVVEVGIMGSSSVCTGLSILPRMRVG